MNRDNKWSDLYYAIQKVCENRDLQCVASIELFYLTMYFVANLAYEIPENINNIILIFNVLIMVLLIILLLWGKRSEGKSFITTIFDNFSGLAMFALLCVAMKSTILLCIIGGVALLQVIALLLPKVVKRNLIPDNYTK